MPGIHGKGKDFAGVTKVVQDVYLAFARTGDPNTDAAPFVAFLESAADYRRVLQTDQAPSMTMLDAAGGKVER